MGCCKLVLSIFIAHVQVKPFAKGYTITFENCAMRTKIKPENLPKGDKAREVREVVQYHAVHPDCKLIPHQDYVNDDSTSNSKTYPVWRNEDADHNRTHEVRYFRRLTEIVEGAGGTCHRTKE